MAQSDKQTSSNSLLMFSPNLIQKRKLIFHLQPCLSVLVSLQRGSDELLSQAAVMAPASDNTNQDLASKKAKLDAGTVLGGVGKSRIISVSFVRRPPISKLLRLSPLRSPVVL